jgi:phospholipase C
LLFALAGPLCCTGALLAGAATSACSGHHLSAVPTGWDGDAAADAPLGDAATVEEDAASDAGPAPAPRPQRDPRAERAACGFRRGAHPAHTLGPGAVVGHKMPIDHVVVLVQENRSFDSYFGHLADYEARRASRTGIVNAIEGLPPGASNPSVPRGLMGLGAPDAGVVVTSPHYAAHATRLCMVDTPHDWLSMHVDWDEGRNDGFYFVNNDRGGPGGNLHGIDPSLTTGDRALTWYDERDIPFYYDLYSTFGMADHYHADVLGPTYPNRMFLYAGTSFGQMDNYNPNLKPYAFPGPDPALVWDELQARGVSWALYGESAPASATILGVTFKDRYGFDPARSFQNFLDDAASGTLPAVSFLDADFAKMAPDGDDEHPPADIELGQHFVWQVVNAVTTSPLWSSTVLFVTYDEAGGLYDHVPPPKACEPDAKDPIVTSPFGRDASKLFDHYGFRVPLVVVSPYVKRSFVSHETYSHASILRFIEARLDGPALSARDANADPFTDMFDWDNPSFLKAPAFAEPSVDQAKVAACKADLTPTP